MWNFAGLAERRPRLALLLAVAACEVAGASGAVFTSMGLGEWYPSLAKPALTPPDRVFGPVWTALFASIGVAAWLVWRRHDEPGAGAAAGLFVLQFVLNVSWSAAFFGARSPAAGLVVISLLWMAVAATAAAFHRVDRRAAYLMLPYLTWVTFAAYLNYAIWRLN